MVARFKPEDSNARDLSNISTIETNPLSKRQYQVYCGCGFTLDPTDCDAAVNMFTAWISKGIDVGPNVGIYAFSNSVIAFFCNSQNFGITSPPVSIFTSNLNTIKQSCGRYIAGSMGGPGDYSEGYMRYYDGLDFCGNALTSPVNKC